MTNRSMYTNHAKAVVLALAWLLMLALQSSAQELSNDRLTLRLSVTPEGIPIIKEALWRASGHVAFRDLGTPDGLNDWAPAALIPNAATTPTAWEISEADDWTTAEASSDLANNMRLTWIVELPKQGHLMRLRMRLTNNSNKARAVEWFPAWAASWDVGGQAQWARWWQALTYDRTEQALSDTRTFHLGSRLHSSDDAGGGVIPYWIVGGDASRIYFGLQWSGGWSATLRAIENGFTYSVGLPPEETQLVLSRREAIEGPTLLVMPIASADEDDARASWMRQRYDLGRVRYGGPRASFPLTYNTWYAIGEAVDDGFLNRQVAASAPYAFDAFVVDAGWFSDGRWKANKKRFPGNDLAEILAALKADGIKAGLWSTPQYVSPASNSAGLAVEDPPVTMPFFNGALADLSTDSFADYLSHHVQALRADYSIDYWKYDQAFFTDTSSAGEMKNVIGLQNALQAVRQNNPDLTIENCQSGGRMINDFTLLTTQTSWLRDGKASGLDGARSNISVALGALDFIFPWAALRFTNNFDEIDASNDELNRLYCRSAMIGRWGISSDLSLISEQQQRVILKEVENYRRISPIKYACEYDLQLPNDEAAAVGVTFYSGRRSRAGVLLYRWQRDGAFDQQVALTKLKPELTYHIVDVDTGAEVTASGSELMTNGIKVSFNAGRLSALLFIDSVTATPAP